MKYPTVEWQVFKVRILWWVLSNHLYDFCIDVRLWHLHSSNSDWEVSIQYVRYSLIEISCPLNTQRRSNEVQLFLASVRSKTFLPLLSFLQTSTNIKLIDYSPDLRFHARRFIIWICDNLKYPRGKILVFNRGKDFSKASPLRVVNFTNSFEGKLHGTENRLK